jgi:integrase
MAEDGIKKITLQGGKVRYRAVVDGGYIPKTDKATGEVLTDPETGEPLLQRKQITITRDTKTEVKEERARIIHQRAAGTLVLPTAVTVSDLIDMWLKAATRDVELATKRSYEDAMRYVRTHLGYKRLQELSEDDVESLIDWMLTSARRRGGKAGTGVGERTVSLTLGRLRAALNLAVRRQLVARNVAEHVTIPRAARKEAKAKKKTYIPWTQDEVQTFLAHVATDRLYAVWLLALIGLRPAEVAGLRWIDVDLDAGTLRVETTRTMVAGVVEEKDAKSSAGERGLPLPEIVWQALKVFRRRQVKEQLAAGEGWHASGRVACDEIGREVKTDWLRRRAYKAMETAEVRKVRLYDARHACLSWMANNGVPDVVVSAWAGHADLSFTKRVYVHSDPDALRAGSEKLGEFLA